MFLPFIDGVVQCRSQQYGRKLERRELAYQDGRLSSEFVCAATESLNPVVFEILGCKRIGVTTHKFDLSRSRDVIGHVTV